METCRCVHAKDRLSTSCHTGTSHCMRTQKTGCQQAVTQERVTACAHKRPAVNKLSHRNVSLHAHTKDRLSTSCHTGTCHCVRSQKIGWRQAVNKLSHRNVSLHAHTKDRLSTSCHTGTCHCVRSQKIGWRQAVYKLTHRNVSQHAHTKDRLSTSCHTGTCHCMCTQKTGCQQAVTQERVTACAHKRSAGGRLSTS